MKARSILTLRTIFGLLAIVAIILIVHSFFYMEEPFRVSSPQKITYYDKTRFQGAVSSRHIVDNTLSKSPNGKVIMVVIGTRPDAIKMAPIITELRDRGRNTTCVTVSVGQHREMLAQVMEVFKLEDAVDFHLDVMQQNQTLSNLNAAILQAITDVLNAVRPDIVVVQGDTTTSFAAALAAFYHKIPVAHVEAGLRTRNIYSPFPEEFNRLAIGDVAHFHFAATPWAAGNLISECKDQSTISVTGNTVVDALMTVLNATSKTPKLESLIQKANSTCRDCKIILLTAHRRENHGKPLMNIIKAVGMLLQKFENMVVIYPVHLNPNVRASIKLVLGESVYNALSKGDKVRETLLDYLNRLIIAEPFDYVDFSHLMQESYFILTDSGGVQEEGVSLGRPVLVLRENTERPEAVASGAAKLVGTSVDSIYGNVSEVFTNKQMYDAMAQPLSVYGDGHSAERIIDILLKDGNEQHLSFNCSQITPSTPTVSNELKKVEENLSSLVTPITATFDLVIVLTVWRRTKLDRQLTMIRRQSILRKPWKISIVIFQNSNHINVTNIVEDWSRYDKWHPFNNVNVTFIHSPISTGYYGRFLVPFLVNTHPESMFIIGDDDIIWGDLYFENMLRVVGDGYLATRNGRYMTEKMIMLLPAPLNGGGARRGAQVTFEEDILYDFGGHTWAGKLQWLKYAWQHPPPTFAFSEDFWISATIKKFHGIGTKSPRCPNPALRFNNSASFYEPHLCACSDVSAVLHQTVEIGKEVEKAEGADATLKTFGSFYGYTPIVVQQPDIMTRQNKLHSIHPVEKPVFNTSSPIFSDCLYFV